MDLDLLREMVRQYIYIGKKAIDGRQAIEMRGGVSADFVGHVSVSEMLHQEFRPILDNILNGATAEFGAKVVGDLVDDVMGEMNGQG